MLQIILSIIAIILAGSYSLSLLGMKDRTLPSIALVLVMSAFAALEIFDLFALLHSESFTFWKKLSLLAEGCLPLPLFIFSVTYAREVTLRPFSFRQVILIICSCLFPIIWAFFPVSFFFYSPDFVIERIIFLGNIGYFFYVAFLGFIIVALINLEITLASATREARWTIKFEVLGIGALLAVLVFYYSQGLLYRSLDMSLVPLRSVALIVATVMMAYSRFWRGREVKVAVSSQMAFRSIVLLVVGIYLVSLGLLGEGMKYFGDSFQRSLIMAIGFLTGIGLLVILLSETAKRKLKVFIHKNFYRHKFDYRTQWLNFTDRLASARSGDDLLRSIVSGFCETFGMGCGGLFLYNSEHDFYISAAIIEMETCPIVFRKSDPLLADMIAKKWVIHIPEQCPEPGVKQGEFLARHSMVFAVPLSLDDKLEGFILLGRPLSSNESYNYEDYDLMKTLARQGTSAIQNMRLSDELFRARELEAVGKLSAFIVHDLKNLVSTLALVVDNAKQFIDNPEFQVDMLESLDSTVAKMNKLILRLKNIQDTGPLRRVSADLLAIAGSAARQVGTGEVKVSGSSVFSEVDVEEIQKLLLNLYLNALDACGGKGVVYVEVGCDDAAYIRVRDEGCGMTEDFILKYLFRPFCTTKNKGLGIGLYQCKQVVEAHGGSIEVASEVGKGTSFTVILPGLGESV
jgi:putative PEP-CTERM system histidine kinase